MGRRQPLPVVVLLSLVSAGEAAAHHPSGAPRLEPTVGLLPQTGATSSPRSRVSVVTRYLNLVDQAPSYAMPVAREGDHVGILDVGYSHAFMDRVTMTFAVPMVLRVPAEEESAAGLGDARLGSRVFPWWGHDGSFSLALDLSLPTGGVADDEDDDVRFGAGAFVPRGSALFTHRLGRFSFTVEGGISGATREGGHLELDYGGALAWTPLSWFGLYAGARARTFLRDDDGLVGLGRSSRRAGDCIVVISPGLRLTPTEDLAVTLGPQLPVTTLKDDDGGATIRLDILL